MNEPERSAIWSKQATADLFEIWKFLALEASAERADAQLRSIDRAIGRLVEWPQAGPPRDEIRPGLRSLLMHPYVIFYRLAEAVEIVRVLHQRRDIGNAFSAKRP